MNKIEDFRRGDFVMSVRHGHKGRISGFSRLTNEDAAWVECQSIPLTIEDIQGRFVDILCHGGGAVVVPEASCAHIPAIKYFVNLYA